MKNYKWQIVVAVIVAAALAFTFWYGGNSPDSQGLTSDNDKTTVADDTANNAENIVDEPNGDSATDNEGGNTANTAASGQADGSAKIASASGSTANSSTANSSKMEINPETGKDKYQTTPVSEGKPTPVEPQDATVSNTAYSCTISISCATILNNLDYCDPEKVELVPSDGWILQPTTVTFYEGESVFNVLRRVCKQNKIHMEYTDTPMYNSAYIEGINNIYEFDVGEKSGWLYKVNGWFPNYGCSRYQLQDGDVVCLEYTCDLGADLGKSIS
jgi:hypothetical protein